MTHMRQRFRHGPANQRLVVDNQDPKPWGLFQYAWGNFHTRTQRLRDPRRIHAVYEDTATDRGWWFKRRAKLPARYSKMYLDS
jgi:hypothetical protein